MGQIAPMLHPEDFYLPAHQTLYAAALGLHTDNRPVDLVTLAEHLRDQGSLEQAGGAAYIADLAQSHVSAANAEYYAKRVRDKSIPVSYTHLSRAKLSPEIRPNVSPGRAPSAMSSAQ